MFLRLAQLAALQLVRRHTARRPLLTARSEVGQRSAEALTRQLVLQLMSSRLLQQLPLRVARVVATIPILHLVAQEAGTDHCLREQLLLIPLQSQRLWRPRQQQQRHRRRQQQKEQPQRAILLLQLTTSTQTMRPYRLHPQLQLADGYEDHALGQQALLVAVQPQTLPYQPWMCDLVRRQRWCLRRSCWCLAYAATCPLLAPGQWSARPPLVTAPPTLARLRSAFDRLKQLWRQRKLQRRMQPRLRTGCGSVSEIRLPRVRHRCCGCDRSTCSPCRRCGLSATQTKCGDAAMARCGHMHMHVQTQTQVAAVNTLPQVIILLALAVLQCSCGPNCYEQMKRPHASLRHSRFESRRQRALRLSLTAAAAVIAAIAASAAICMFVPLLLQHHQQQLHTLRKRMYLWMRMTQARQLYGEHCSGLCGQPLSQAMTMYLPAGPTGGAGTAAKRQWAMLREPQCLYLSLCRPSVLGQLYLRRRLGDQPGSESQLRGSLPACLQKWRTQLCPVQSRPLQWLRLHLHLHLPLLHT